jgi:argininosuccinate lyase
MSSSGSAEINKASTVINSEEGLLDRALAPKLAAGIDKVIKAGNAARRQAPGPRSSPSSPC